jgi:hypothetical protein
MLIYYNNKIHFKKSKYRDTKQIYQIKVVYLMYVKIIKKI